MLVWTINYIYGHASYSSFSRRHIPSSAVTSVRGPTKLLPSWMPVLTPKTWIRQLMSLGRKPIIFIFLHSYSRQLGTRSSENHRTEMQWFWWLLFLCLVSDTSVFLLLKRRKKMLVVYCCQKRKERSIGIKSVLVWKSVRIWKVKLGQNQRFILNHLVLLRLQQVILWVLFCFVWWWACHFFCVSSYFRWVSLVTWRIRSCPCTLKSWSCRRALMEDVRETWWNLCKEGSLVLLVLVSIIFCCRWFFLCISGRLSLYLFFSIVFLSPNILPSYFKRKFFLVTEILETTLGMSFAFLIKASVHVSVTNFQVF